MLPVKTASSVVSSGDKHKVLFMLIKAVYLEADSPFESPRLQMRLIRLNSNTRSIYS